MFLLAVTLAFSNLASGNPFEKNKGMGYANPNTEHSTNKKEREERTERKISKNSATNKVLDSAGSSEPRQSRKRPSTPNEPSRANPFEENKGMGYTDQSRSQERVQARPTGTAQNSSLRKSSPEVEIVQMALRARGLYHDEIDGLMGENTIKGIKQWQRRRHLIVTGKLRDHVERTELICGVFPQEGNCAKEYKPVPDNSSFFSRQWTLALFLVLLTGWVADWIGLVAAGFSGLFLILYFVAMPTADKRFSSGYKDNATPGSFSLVLYTAITACMFWGYAWGIGSLCWEGFVSGNIDCNYCRIGTIGYDGVVKSYPRGFFPANF